jgi:hypothetical protein
LAATEQIKWTAVPNGSDGTSFSLSIMVSPELNGGTSGTLTDFPDFANWPNFLLGLSNPGWEVTFTNASGSFRFRIPVAFTPSSGGIALNPTLWDDLFSGVSYGPPEPVQDRYRNIAIASYPAGHITGFLQGQYSQYDPTKVPTLGDVQSTYGAISDVLVGVAAQQRMSRLAAERAANSNGGKRPHANNFSNASMADAFAAQAFYHLPAAGELPSPGFEGPIDFHKALTFVGEHFVLQRALGLVFDIQVGDLGRLQGLLGQGTLYVDVELTDRNSDSVPIPTFGQTPKGAITYTPVKARTQCDFGLNPPVFQATSSSGNIVNRQLRVNDPQQPNLFLAHTIDFDIGGLRAANFATQINLQLAPATASARYTAALESHKRGNGHRPDLAFPELAEILLTPTPPPMIRSNGLTLTEVNRGVNLADRLERAFLLFDAVANNPSGPPPVPDLTAEDLVRGYIMDVLDTDDNTWRSTAQRRCTYEATPSGGGAVNVTLDTATLRPLDEASTQAPPRVQNSPSDPNTQQANVSEVILRYNGWSNAAPRPGSPLQDSDFGIGTADSPFSQLTITATALAGSLTPLRFGHSYQMRARVVDICNNFVPLAAGDTSGVTVTDAMPYGRHEAIGSPDVYQQSPTRPSESLKRLVIRDVDVAGSGGFPASSLRAVAPQRVQEPFAEWMGTFDNPAGQIQPTAYSTIVPAESAHYPDPNPDPTAQTATITLTDPVPYLPDPVARGGVLTIFDGMAPPNGLAGTAVNFDFSPTDQWPHYRPVGLLLQPGGAPANAPVQAASFDASTRLITFTLSESDTITMSLCCTCDPADVGKYGLGVYWGNPDANAVAAGQYWSITPAIQLELIYAVQQPLLTPEFPSFPSPGRQQGETFAPLVAQLAYSPKSTSNIHVKASWGEPVDDPIHPTVAVQGPGAPNPSLRQTANSPVVTLPTPQSPLASFGTQDYSATDQWTANHEFFDTKHRNVTYEAVATSQFEEFYPPGTDVTKATQTPVQVNIPSSARPESLHIPYVVPSYGWSMAHHGKTTTSQRSPSSLRVFIRRPWWSSGIDELLGVVTWPEAEGHALTIPTSQVLVFGRRHQSKPAKRHRGKHHARTDFRIPPIGPGGPVLVGPSTGPIPKDQALYVTDWGADPVFESPALPTLHPTMSAFTNAVHYGVGLDIEEKSDITVNVAGHPVVFDPQRNLWYCDIAVDTGASYTPMIRLALARFQPNSVSGVELGRIVLVDFMQLEPGRTASIVRSSPHHISNVTVSGYSYSAAAGARDVAPGAAEVIIERRVPGIHDDTVGWEQVGDPIGMSPVGQFRFLRIGGLPGGNETTTWSAGNIKIPAHGTHRLVINQYEVLPTDNRTPTRGFYFLQQRSREVRLLYQDIIPL